jgi:hypothetical protein
LGVILRPLSTPDWTHKQRNDCPPFSEAAAITVSPLATVGENPAEELFTNAIPFVETVSYNLSAGVLFLPLLAPFMV